MSSIRSETDKAEPNTGNETETFPVWRGWEYARRGEYHRQLDLDWSYAPTYLRKMALVRQFLAEQPKDVPILDAGCGEGVLVQEFREQGWAIEGLDLNYSSQHVRQGTVLDMSFYRDDHFGIVLLLDVFEHLSYLDQPVALREIGRVLRPQGTLLISIPNLAHLNSRFHFGLRGQLDRTDLDRNHIGERPMRENVRLLEAEGFQIQRTVGITLTVPLLYRRVICRWPRNLRWLHDVLDLVALPSLSLLNLFWCCKDGSA